MLVGPRRGLLRSAPVAASSFLPSDISNLVVWYDASSGVYNDAGSTPATDTQTVQQWNDRSGNSYHLSQATSGNRPVYNSAGFNSTKPCLTFNSATPTYIVTGSGVGSGTIPAYGTAVSMFIVGQMGSGSEAYGRMFTSVRQAGGTDYNHPDSFDFARDNTNQNYQWSCNSVNSTPDAFTYDTPSRFGLIFTGSAGVQYLNNAAGSTDSISTNFSSALDIIIGGGYISSAYSTYMTGKIAEVVVYAAALDSTQRTNLDDYFKSKWGL